MRVSATTLESFRLYMAPDQEWKTEASLLEDIAGTFVPTRPVEIGKAFGLVLETPDRYKVRGGYVCNGFSFDDAAMAEPLSLMDRRGVYEAKAIKRYGDVDVVSKADQIIGCRLREHKTTCSTFSFEKYADSFQWRLMADAFEPLQVSYYVFCLDDHENGVITVKSVETFNLYPYAQLHEDCAELVDQFRAYVTAKGLDTLLRQRQIDAERRVA